MLTPHNSHLSVIPPTVSSDDVALNEDGHEAGRLADKDPNDDAQLLEVEEEEGEAKAVASRLLTKKQIGDMAFGIRELAKKLAHIKIKLKVKNIFILCKAHDEGLIKDARDVSEWLLAKDPNCRVYVEHTLEENKKFDAEGLHAANSSFKGRLRYWTNEMCAEKPGTFDIVLAVSSPNCEKVSSLTTRTARRRWHRTLRFMAVPTRRTTCSGLLAWLARLPHEVRLQQVPADAR